MIGWGWYYLSTIMDDYSRYIAHWKLCEIVNAEDVKRTVDRAMKVVGLTNKRPPKLLSDNGPCHVSKDLVLSLVSIMKYPERNSISSHLLREEKHSTKSLN
ncbi:transposase [Proteiniphilum sp. X52]|nr:transposase [Proteiniphilum sp. X52]